MYGRPSNGYKRRAYPTTRFKKRRYSQKRSRYTPASRRMAPGGNFAAKVRSVVKAESKFLYSFSALQEFRRTQAFVSNLSSINQGLGASTRIGNWIQPTVLYGHITVTGDTAAVLATSSVRVCLVQYHEDESQAAFDASILLENTLTPGGPWQVISKGKYSILWSSYFTITNDFANLAFTRTLAFNVKMHKRPRVLYATATQKKEQLFFVALTDIDVGAGAAPLVATQIQLRYSDS